MMACTAMLTGCATGPSRQEILQGLVGRPESELLRTFGVPDRVIEANGHKFLAYDDRSLGYEPVLPSYGLWGPFAYGYVVPATVPVVRGCNTTVEVVEGKVASWSERGTYC